MTARLIAIGLVGVLAQIASAQPAPPPPPLPAENAAGQVANPPPFAGDAEEPQVTIIRRENETREEVRIGGTLRFIRVTPTHGRPYYLVPEQGTGQFNRRDSLDSGLRVPMWMLFSW